jgi:predicted phosphoribosyltransferase
MLEAYSEGRAIVMAIPAGGVPVAKEMANRLNLPLDLAVVSKITLPWNTEAGYGAVAFDGTVRLNDDLVRRVGLSPEQIEQGIKTTSRKVSRRVEELRGDRDMPDLHTYPVILADDGLASGFTMRVAVEALRNGGASRVIVAVPTAHQRSVERIAAEVEMLYCANIRSGWSFAVADAYERWTDVAMEEVRAMLATPPPS